MDARQIVMREGFQGKSCYTVLTFADHQSITGLKQTWEIERFSIITRWYMYVGKREEKITTEYEKLRSLLCFVNEFPKT